MNEIWSEIRKSGDYVKLGEQLGVLPATARVLRNRDLADIEDMKRFMSADLSLYSDGRKLKHIRDAAMLLKDKIQDGKPIRIIGDYDVDGICATYILYKGLTFFKADVDYDIPHRIFDGYGINIELIDKAYKAKKDTILTCDNGIAASLQTKHAKELGLTVVITDHHEVPFDMEDGVKTYHIPDADAVVDPKLPDESYPFPGICGAYVAFKFIQELGEVFSQTSYDADSFSELISELKEFAGLATVCDVMDLKDENRALVKESLSLVSHSKNPGMRALLSVNEILDRSLSAFHFGFIVGPSLNASGRLDTSMRAMELFCEKEEARALSLAKDLKALNDERKDMTLTETERAIELVVNAPSMDKVLVVYLPDCHESLAGIIAGRLRERFVRPAFVITNSEHGLKGSGRSIDAYDMYEELTKVKDLLTKFGGHKLAAGISLAPENLDAFRKQLNENTTLTDADFVEKLRIDMELPFYYASLRQARELERLEPYGVGNDKPLFARRKVTFLSGRRLGERKNVARYTVSDEGGRVYELTYFGDFDAFEEYVGKLYGAATGRMLHSGKDINICLDIVYQLSVNSYRGNDSAQLLLKYYR